MRSGGFAPCWRWSGRLLVAGPLTHRLTLENGTKRTVRLYETRPDGVALDDETAESISDLMSKWRATVLDAPLLGSRFHRELHLREACSNTLFDAVNHENGSERMDTVQE